MRDTLIKAREVFMRHPYLIGSVCVVCIVVGFISIFRDTSMPTDPRAPLTTLIREDDWVRGNPESARSILIEYSDFACPACSTFHGVLKQLEGDSGKDIALVYRHFPLSAIHPNAEYAARAAEAAGMQQKFFEMHDELFMNQNEWVNEPDPKERFLSYATHIGLDIAQFERDLDSDDIAQKINEAKEFGEEYNLKSTPTFFINGIEVPPVRTYAEFKQFILSHTYTE